MLTIRPSFGGIKIKTIVVYLTKCFSKVNSTKETVMKKQFTLHSLVIASVIFLVGCGEAKSVKKNNTTEQKGNKQMTRAKTASGLEYEIITEGSGASPVKGKPVTVHYTGWLNENDEPGTKFDSSVDRGQQFKFVIGIGQVIPGWDEGVMSMKIGEKRRLYIPAKLGYGARGAGRLIPPNANLIFDVELFNVS